MKKRDAPLQGSVRGYIREISVAMFLQIQTDIFITIELGKIRKRLLKLITDNTHTILYFIDIILSSPLLIHKKNKCHRSSMSEHPSVTNPVNPTQW